MRALDSVLTQWDQPRSSERGVAVAASAGGIPALIALLSALERPFSFPIFVTQHLPHDAANLLPRTVRWHSGHVVEWAEHGRQPEAGTVYLCPAAQAMRVRKTGFELSPLSLSTTSWLPCPDMLFESVAATYKSGAVGIVLSGLLAVALNGLRAIRAAGGLTIAQSQGSASHGEMPSAAVDFGRADIALPPALIAEALSTFDQEPGIAPAVARAALSAPPPRVRRSGAPARSAV